MVEGLEEFEKMSGLVAFRSEFLLAVGSLLEENS